MTEQPINPHDKNARPFWKRRRWLVIVGLPAILFGLYYFVWAPTYSWNQKLTLEVQTPEGVKSSHAIVNAWFTKQPLGFPGIAKWKGEAVVVNLGEGKYLFATLGHPVKLMAETSRILHPDCNTSWLCNYRKMTRWFSSVGELDVPPDAYPLLVTFDDITKPETVREVDPAELSEVFGEGYSLKTMTLEITQEAVTTGKVEQALGWWLSYRAGPYNSMKSLKLLDESPRGWRNLSVLEFWSLDRVQDFDRRNE